MNRGALGQTLDFPIPQIIFGDDIPTYSRFYEEPLNFDSITHSHTYDDERKTFNQTTTAPPRRWQVEFNGISAAKAQVLSLHDVDEDSLRKIIVTVEAGGPTGGSAAAPSDDQVAEHDFEA